MLGQLDEALELTTCALSHARNREEIQELMQLMIYTRSQVRVRVGVGVPIHPTYFYSLTLPLTVDR